MDDHPTAAQYGAHHTDPMLDALAAGGPHPEHAEALRLYGQFIGSWSVDNRSFDEATGGWQQTRRVWRFGWVLGGRGVQDVLTDVPGGEAGTTVRVYDPRISAWRLSWFGPVGGNYCTLVGRPDGDTILQEGTQTDGRPIRWIFSDISSTSFHWQGFVSDDGGTTWRLEQEMRARRD